MQQQFQNYFSPENSICFEDGHLVLLKHTFMYLFLFLLQKVKKQKRNVVNPALQEAEIVTKYWKCT